MRTINDDFDYQVLNLTDKFYTDYPEEKYPELLQKDPRPYNCLLIQSHYGYFICVPYRTNVRHRYSFRFQKFDRSSTYNPGLDFSKIVIVTNHDYIGNKDAIVNQKQYNKTRERIEHIKNDVQKYVDNYVAGICGNDTVYDSQEFERIYQFSTLQYFHKELGIEK